ncbi:MAG: hypothetical protein E6K19_09375, partial [Methanobacteriota archaeon]
MASLKSRTVSHYKTFRAVRPQFFVCQSVSEIASGCRPYFYTRTDTRFGIGIAASDEIRREAGGGSASERRRILVGTSWTATSTVVGVIIGLVSRPLLVAFVGIDGYGVWASAIAVASMFSLGGDLGVASVLPKIIAESRGQKKDEGTIASSSLLFAVFTGAIASVALILSSPFIGQRIAFPDFPLLLQIQSIQMPLNFGIGSLFALLQGGRSFKEYSISTILLASSNLLLMIVFLALGAGLIGVMVASPLSTSILFALLIVLNRK